MTATSRYSVPVVALENLVAASTNFVTAVGGIDYAGAKKFIHYQETSDIADPDNVGGQVEDRRPRAIIHFDNYPRTRQGPGTWSGDPKLCLVLEITPPKTIWPGQGTPHDAKAEFVWFANLAGLIEADLEANSGGGNVNGDRYFNVHNIIDILGPAPCDPREEGGAYFWIMEWMLTGR